MKQRILVVGTTGDYINLLKDRFPGQLLFVTDPTERELWPTEAASPADEILIPLDDGEAVAGALMAHLCEYGYDLAGVVCFDCESLLLAARLADRLGLPFVSEASVRACRSKYRSKALWRVGGALCPRAAAVRRAEDVLAFLETAPGPVVLKPLTGSGSELIFLCRDSASCIEAFDCLKTHLTDHPNQRMYGRDAGTEEGEDGVIGCVEDYVGGEEYSCDFVKNGDVVDVLRITRKLPFEAAAFGSILAYELMTGYPVGMPAETLQGALRRAAGCLGLERTVAMVDFKLENGQIFLLEMTPRIGGDCLPPLVRAGGGHDAFQVALDFSVGTMPLMPQWDRWKPLVGMHLFADRAGQVQRIQANGLLNDPRVRDHVLKRKQGDLIRLPPEDYDSRILGWVIFEPIGATSLAEQCADVAAQLEVEIR